MKHYDMEQFRHHCADTVNIGESITTKQASADELLYFWYQNKSKYLYDLMGEQLILSRSFKYTRSEDELRGAMIETMRKHINWESAFWESLRLEFNKIYGPDWDDAYNPNHVRSAAEVEADAFYTSLQRSMYPESLVHGRIELWHRYLNKNTYTVEIRGEKISISSGQKTMKVLGKISKIFGLEEEFEAMRIAHSQVLNQKTIVGDLHLSIHPLDYATASDNNNGWDSCMSWYNNGCYRLGTVEMMNSPCVICAYITGKNVMEDVGGGTWNSKKWRAWIIVDKGLIVMNRQYPYHNDNIAKEAIDWVAELASVNLGWHYDTFESDFYYGEAGFDLTSDYMYNDFDGSCPGRVGLDVKHGYEINFSGPANCMWCGEEIAIGEIDASTTVCNKCQDAVYCTCCGEYIQEDDIAWGPDNMPYCYSCYNDTFVECDNCGATVSRDETTHIKLAYNRSLFEKLWKNADKNSAFYHKYTYGFCEEILYPDTDLTICNECLEAIGVNVETDILYDVEMPFTQFKSYWRHSYSTGNILDPRKVDHEKAMDVFGIPHMISQINAWEILWNDYAETLYTHGIISRE